MHEKKNFYRYIETQISVFNWLQGDGVSIRTKSFSATKRLSLTMFTGKVKHDKELFWIIKNYIYIFSRIMEGNLILCLIVGQEE